MKGIGVLLVEWQLYFDVGAREVAWIGMATGCIYKTAGKSLFGEFISLVYNKLITCHEMGIRKRWQQNKLFFVMNDVYSFLKSMSRRIY